MVTGELKNKIDILWEIFWTGGLTNPLDVIEQMTYLMFIHDLDEADSLRAKESAMLGLPYESLFPPEAQVGGRTIDGSQLKWSTFHDFPAGKMYSVVQEWVFPFIKELHGDRESAYSKYMADAIFKLPTPLILDKVVTAMDGIYAQMEQVQSADVRGDVYEYLLSKLSTAGVNGQFRTPRHIIRMMVDMLRPEPDDTVCDPTCGSGSLLIKTAKKQNISEVSIYGQEVNGSSVAMAKMNMYIHEIRDAQIAWGDTLAFPAFLDNDGNLRLFDAIVANMPFSKDKWASGFNPGGESSGKGKREFKMEPSLDKYHRFDWGVPPASKGDWAFLLHMIASLSVNGRIAAVAPHGVLFRGAAEGRIRQKVIEENLLDAVIGLPENLFYGTSIPACILVFKKNRTTTDVLFIDASKKDEEGNLRYIKATNQNELGQKHIDDIVGAYQRRTDIPKLSHVATLDEIKDNEYNLNIPRYVDTFEEEELIDIEAVQANIARLKKEIAEAEAQMDAYLRELGL